jgi:hypothetical protein
MKLTRPQRFLKAIFPALGTRYAASRQLLGRRNSFLYESGWLESLRRDQPCRPDGSPTPWMNHAAIALLEERLASDFDVFEWGSGYSTLFFAQRVRRVTSVEYDKAWHERVSRQAPANVRVLYREQDTDGDYCRAILAESGRYDVVVVDGRDRVNCIRHGLSRLTDRGVLLLDDAQRERYADGIAYAKSQGLRALPFDGPKPLSHRMARTVVFYRPDNCLGI